MHRLLEMGKVAKIEFEKQNDGAVFQLLLEGRTNGIEFSGWSENYIALSQENFVPYPAQIIKSGNIISGIYRTNY